MSEPDNIRQILGDQRDRVTYAPASDAGEYFLNRRKPAMPDPVTRIDGVDFGINVNQTSLSGNSEAFRIGSRFRFGGVTVGKLYSVEVWNGTQSVQFTNVPVIEVDGETYFDVLAAETVVGVNVSEIEWQTSWTQSLR